MLAGIAGFAGFVLASLLKSRRDFEAGEALLRGLRGLRGSFLITRGKMEEKEKKRFKPNLASDGNLSPQTPRIPQVAIESVRA